MPATTIRPSSNTSWRSSHSTYLPRKAALALLFLMLGAKPAQGFDKFNQLRFSGSSSGEVSNTVTKEQTDKPSLMRGQNAIHFLLQRGRAQSATLVEGVRFVSLLVGIKGGSSQPGKLDQLARSFVVMLGWIVSFQAVGTVVVSHSESLFELASRLMSRETLIAVGMIRRILDSVDDHGVIDIFAKYPPQELVASVYALSRLQAACQFYDRARLKSPSWDSFVDEELLDDLRYYAPFAAATYGWTLDLATAGRLHRGDLNALVKMTGVDRDDIVKVIWESKANRPAFYIVRDRQRKRIVLAIRGTWSAHDVLTDLCCTPEDYAVSSRRYRAHSGMLSAARGVASIAEEIVAEELIERPDYSLVLVGHSLGGSVAGILATLWRDVFRDVKVYAYGAACVTPKGGLQGQNIVSVMSEGDPFSSLSLGHVADISFALGHLCESPDLRATILMRTDGAVSNLEQRDLQWCSDIMEELHEQMVGEKLYPPGRLLFLSRPNRQDRTCEIREVPAEYFRDLKIGARMFDLSQHIPRLYEDRLCKAVLF